MHDALDCCTCNPQAQPSTSFVDHTVDLPWRSFLSPEFGGKFRRDEHVSLFWRYPDFPTTQFRIGIFHAKSRLYPPIAAFAAVRDIQLADDSAVITLRQRFRDDLHVAFDAVLAIKKCLGRHPLHWQSTLA